MRYSYNTKGVCAELGHMVIVKDGKECACGRKGCWETYASATGLVNIINIFQPDVLCVGGGVSNQGENLLGPVRAIVEQERYTKHNDKQTVVVKAMLGNDAGIIGAAYLD